MKAQHEFPVAEWNHAAKMSSQRGRCRPCMKQRQDLRLCSAHRETEVETRECTKCKKQLTQTFFSNSQWCKYGAEKRKCYECCTAPAAPNEIGQWGCVRHDCKKTLPKEQFSLWMKEKNKKYQNNTQVCNQCFVKDRQAEKEQNVKTNKHLQKHHSETHSKKK